jgi:acyl-CoA reductase LuxC
MAEYALDRLFGEIRADALVAVIEDELGGLDVLDAFTRRTGRPAARALPAGRVCIVSSRTTIGVAIVPAIFALCAKCEVVVKDREDYLAAAFFETLAGELALLRAAAVAQTWRGDEEAEQLSEFAAVIAFGTDATIRAIARHVRPPARLMGYGTKASAGYVTREALSDQIAAKRIARSVARDLALYESEGCLSLHALFVEDCAAVSVVSLAESIVEALDEFAVEFGDPPATSAQRIAMAREMAAFRGDALRADTAGRYLALVEPAIDRPPMFLPRSIGIHRVRDAAEAALYLERHAVSLEALAVTSPREDLLELATRVGAARIARFGELQAPPLGVFHGGRPRIAEFVRWIGNET